MNFHKTLLMSAATLALAACSHVSGTLTVSDSLPLDTTRGGAAYDPGCLTGENECSRTLAESATLRLKPGRYPAKVDFDGFGSITLTVEDGAGRHSVVRLALPETVRLPMNGGRFELDRNIIDQPFDLDGAIQIRRVEASLESGREQCHYNAYKRICKVVRDTKTGDKRLSCFERPVTLSGSREVTYQDVRETRRVTLDLTPAGQARPAARFEGSATDNDRIYDHHGACRPQHGLAAFPFY